jgi:diguanylate cyclase (GGDEF)-like protein
MMTTTPLSGSVDRTFPRRNSLLRGAAEFFGLACLVFLLEEAMHHTGFFNHVWQAIWWPTNGLAVAFMVRSSRSRWPLILGAVLFASLLGEIHYHALPVPDLVNGIANAIGPLTAALALPRCRKLDDWLQEPHLVSRFVFFGLIAGPLLSAAIFASYMQWSTPGIDFWSVLQIRADSDMLGYAMFTPLVLVLTSRDNYRRLRPGNVAKSLLFLALVAATTLVVFGQSSYPLDFILVSVILLVSLRLGFATSVLAVNLLATIATVATMHGYGPLTLGGGGAVSHRILLLQAFLALAMITVFSVSVVQIERDVFQTQLEQAYSKMAKLASTDPLTGLGNRRLFEDTLKAEWTRARRSNQSVAVLMIDVDHFKSYNDRFGHPAGDICLCAIANAILGMGHRSSDLLARYGGEEFIFLMPETPIDEAARLAESMRTLIGSLYSRPDSPIHCNVTVSIGCAASAPAPGLFPDLLISSADEALYTAKRNGRNRIEIAKTPARPFAIPSVS